MLADITVGDVLELLDAEASAHCQADRRIARCSTGCSTEMGIFGAAAPDRLRELPAPRPAHPRGARRPLPTCACRPVRDLLVDYLQERQPAMDYSSLQKLSYCPGAGGSGQTWNATTPASAACTCPPRSPTPGNSGCGPGPRPSPRGTGEKTAVTVERISYRQCLTPVRAFYLDLAQWAIEDPGPLGARGPRPARSAQRRSASAKSARHRKARMDARTRERLPVLPVLVRTVDERRKNAAALLQAARQARPGETFTAAGQTLTRSVDHTPHRGRSGPTTRPPASAATWPWKKTTRSGRGPPSKSCASPASASRNSWRSATTAWSSTGCPAPASSSRCCRSSPSKTDTERLLVVSPELADVLVAIIRRIRGSPTGRCPLVRAYDRHECMWRPPSPLLFQRRFGTENRGDQRQHAPQHAQRRPGPHRPDRPRRRAARCTTRRTTSGRIFITDAVMNGLPAAYRPGHRRPPGHQRHYGLQGRLPRRGHPGPPGVPRPAAGAAAQRGIPGPHR